MNFKGISHILVAKLLPWLSLFKHTVRGGKALLYKGSKYPKIHDGKEWTFWRCKRYKSQCPARVTTYEPLQRKKKAPSMYAIITIGGVPAYLYMYSCKRLTVDFDLMGVDPVGSWSIGNWFSGSWFRESYLSHTELLLIAECIPHIPPWCGFQWTPN